jgi:hypothetical protein
MGVVTGLGSGVGVVTGVVGTVVGTGVPIGRPQAKLDNTKTAMTAVRGRKFLMASIPVLRSKWIDRTQSVSFGLLSSLRTTL